MTTPNRLPKALSRRPGPLAGRILLYGALILALWFTGVIGALARWDVMFRIRMPGVSYSGPLLPLTPEETGISDALKQHIQTLAGDIGERNIWHHANLEAAANYINQSLSAMGYRVQTQSYSVAGRVVENIEVEIRGGTRPEEILVIGAHYDTVPGSPGANDNATGVAVLLEVARRFSALAPERTVRLVAFTNEEPPFFQTEQMGSVHYATRSRARGETIVGMISLETIGYYSDTPGSQRYPFPVGAFYPDTGSFLAFVGNNPSKGLLFELITLFRKHARFPSEGGAFPSVIPGIGWSDHWAFWQAGYPAIMITDTALFRYPQYHTPRDAPDIIDHDRLARVTAGLLLTFAEAAGAR